MAKKNDTATKQIDVVGKLAQEQWEATYKNLCAHRQMAAQFHAIGELLGWRGAACYLAKTGQQSADSFAAICDQRCDELRDLGVARHG